MPVSELASPGSRSRAVRKCVSAAAASPFCRSTPASSRYRKALPGELAIAAVRADRLIEPAGAGGGSGIGEPLLGQAELQNLDAPRDLRQRRVGGACGLEGGERFSLAVEREIGFAASDERRRVRRLTFEGAIEMRQRGLLIPARELDVAEADLGG